MDNSIKESLENNRANLANKTALTDEKGTNEISVCKRAQGIYFYTRKRCIFPEDQCAGKVKTGECICFTFRLIGRSTHMIFK